MRRMKHAAAACALVLLLAVPVGAATGNQPKTIFEHAGKAWAVGRIAIGKPLKFRKGRLHVFTGRIVELVSAAQGEPRNIMLTYEVASDEMANPFFKGDEEFFAPIELLPEHSYWRDNLPQTPRHAVAGGRRNVFRGEEMAEAKRVLAPFLEGRKLKGKQRATHEIAAAAAALDSSIVRLREDAARFLAAHPTLGRDFSDAARPHVAKYLASAAPTVERAALIGAIGQGKVEAMTGDLEALSKGSDAVAVAALAALEAMGKPTPVDRLSAMTESKSTELRVFGAERLGRLAARDAAALERSIRMIGPDNPEAVRIAAARGLGASGAAAAVEPLVKEMRRGDGASRAAAEALAAIGGDPAHGALKSALTEGRGETAAAAVHGLRRVRGCSDCGKLLAQQHEQHPEQGVRDLIAVVMEMPVEHKH
ncbi:MAG TPA: hypothetical protein VEC57_00660 [Candidatus Limnocylindrales bacterium]|nr:hypothetical protein [Candidatus Limnocylindrales bacterium]